MICIYEQEFLAVNLWSQTVLNFHGLTNKGLSLENLGRGKADNNTNYFSARKLALRGEREKNRGMPTNAYFLFHIYSSD